MTIEEVEALIKAKTRNTVRIHHPAGFKIRGIPATFSVLSEDRLPDRHYNIQIESYPPQDLSYRYHARAISLWRFLELIRLISGPKENSPRMT